MHGHILSFRAGDDFLQETIQSASLSGLKRSDYVREAVREKNQRMLAKHIAELSRELSSEHRAFNQTLEGTVTDGLD